MRIHYEYYRWDCCAVTVAWDRDKAYGIALCSDTSNFCKEVGRLIAKSRMLSVGSGSAIGIPSITNFSPPYYQALVEAIHSATKRNGRVLIMQISVDTDKIIPEHLKKHLHVKKR